MIVGIQIVEFHLGIILFFMCHKGDPMVDNSEEHTEYGLLFGFLELVYLLFQFLQLLYIMLDEAEGV